MDGNTLDNEIQATGATDNENQGNEADKFYTQEDFDKHMAGMRKAMEAKFNKQLSELGDLDELKQLKVNAEKQRTEEAVKKGDFEKVLQELAQKKDAEIKQRDQVITEYKVNTPLLEAAAKNKAVAPAQVRELLQKNVRLNSSGDVEVVDDTGSVRYNDSGSLLTVDELVSSFLNANPHFVSSGPSSTNTKSNDGSTVKGNNFDISKLDMKNPADRLKYREARDKGLI
jgi:hypothetical protein